MTRILTLLLLLWSPLLWSQPDTQEPPEANADTTGETAPEEQDRPAATDESPFDYQSSEKISEDLSVSFPVDI